MTDKLSELSLVLLLFMGTVVCLIHIGRAWRQIPRHFNGEWVFIGAMIALTVVLLPVADVSVNWLRFADLPFSDEFAWAGLFKGVLAIWLLWRAIVDYRKPGPLSREPAQSGIYRYIRHPLYTALLVFALAQLLLSQNWLAGLLGLATFGLVYGLRAPRDEQRGLERYGHRYLDYMAHTGGLLPRVSIFERRR